MLNSISNMSNFKTTKKNMTNNVAQSPCDAMVMKSVIRFIFWRGLSTIVEVVLNGSKQSLMDTFDYLMTKDKT